MATMNSNPRNTSARRQQLCPFTNKQGGKYPVPPRPVIGRAGWLDEEGSFSKEAFDGLAPKGEA